MLMLVRWIADHLDRPPTVLCWQSGSMVSAFEAVGPVIDAGSVNDNPAALVLAAVRLSAVARPLKSVQLRRALAPLHECDRLLLGGADAAAMLEWLPPSSDRRVSLWVDDGDIGGLAHLTAIATSFLAAGPIVDRALRDQGLPTERVQLVGEPLIDRAPSPATDHRGDIVAVAGATRLTGGALSCLLPVIVASLGQQATKVALVHDDLRQSWERWTDAAWAGLEAQVDDWRIDHCRHRMADLAALVLLGPVHDALAVQAAQQGVPVLALGNTTESVADAREDAVALIERLRALLTDPAVWKEASEESARRADRHRVDRVGRAVLQSLDLRGR